MSVAHAGLCESCRHQRVVKTTRGSRFSLCRRSESDPAYPRYPRVPVLECPGFETGGGSGLGLEGLGGAEGADARDDD